MSLTIERVPLEGPALARAYIQDHARVACFYRAGPPTELDSYRRVAERIREGRTDSRWESLSELAADLEGGLPDRLARAIEGRGVFVATGQQAGLFVSPLFTLYKALTAVRLAQQLEDRLRLPVVPLFSVASEDHDWAEVDHTRIIDLENRLRRLSVDSRFADTSGPTPPVERIELGPDVEGALDELAQATPDTEFKSSVLTPLREAYRPGRSAAHAFQTALRHLLRRQEVMMVRTANPWVKRETRETLWRDWERREQSEARLLERSEALGAAGFEPQVPISAGTTNLFLEGALGRDRILHDAAGARLRRSGERLGEGELRRVLDETPERLSPGALLRPVAEARAFPIVAYVGGPGEIAYLAQSQVLFELHDVPAPVVVPRAGFRLIEPKVAKVLEKYGIGPDELAGDTATAIARLVDEHTPPELRESLSHLRSALAEALERVEAAALETDAGAGSALGSGKQAIFAGVKALESKLGARVREQHQVMQRQLEKAAVNLYPEGKPQERALNPYPYLVRYGEQLLDEIYTAVVTPLG